MKQLIENLLELQSLEFDGQTGAGTAERIGALRAEIPTQILGHYDRLLARGKKGVAIVRRQICSECHMQVPRNTVLTLMHGEDIQICENCGRYLCLPEQVHEPEPAEKKPARRKRKVLQAVA